MLIVQSQISIFTYLSATVIDRALPQWLPSNQSFIQPTLFKHRLFIQLLLTFPGVYLIHYRDPDRGEGSCAPPGGDPTACHGSPSHSHLVIIQEVI